MTAAQKTEYLIDKLPAIPKEDTKGLRIDLELVNKSTRVRRVDATVVSTTAASYTVVSTTAP